MVRTLLAAAIGHVTSLQCAAGLITVLMDAAGKNTLVHPDPDPAAAPANDNIVWVCALRAAAQNKYVPAECRL